MSTDLLLVVVVIVLFLIAVLLAAAEASLLRVSRMRAAIQHFAVAVDEHGGPAGIVTIEDS